MNSWDDLLRYAERQGLDRRDSRTGRARRPARGRLRLLRSLQRPGDVPRSSPRRGGPSDSARGNCGKTIRSRASTSIPPKPPSTTRAESSTGSPGEGGDPGEGDRPSSSKGTCRSSSRCSNQAGYPECRRVQRHRSDRRTDPARRPVRPTSPRLRRRLGRIEGDVAGRGSRAGAGYSMCGSPRLPAGEDPDSFIRKNGGKAFQDTARSGGFVS